MDEVPLVIEEIDAGRQLVSEFQDYKPVRVAFWLKRVDEPRQLYLASDSFDDGSTIDDYKEVLRIAKRQNSLFLSPYRVNIIENNHPLALAAESINTQFTGPMPNRIGPTMFGGIFVEDVYIYPTLVPVAA